MRTNQLVSQFIISAALGCVALGSAAAQGKIRGTMRLGAEMGGDKVIQFQYADGSTPDVTAGGGLLISAGAILQVVEINSASVDAQLNAGWKYRTIPKASNQEASWSRFPVEALLAYNTPVGLRISAGGVVHLANKLEASGAAVNGSVDFKTTPGFVVQTEYLFRNGLAIDARYTGMKYRIDGSGSESIDGSSFGIGGSVYFGGSKASKPTTKR
ncbi:MAG TPA: hypothetical protein VFT29_20315 [Gemmatimonadaceae bacterium]|nr:hypothetical protein [Gemmatimonadaceae bacterium]